MWVFTQKKALVIFASMIISSIIGVFVFAPSAQALQTDAGITCNPKIKIGNDYFDHLVYAVGPGGAATLTPSTVVYNDLPDNDAYIDIEEAMKSTESRPYLYFEPTSPGANNRNVRDCNMKFGVYIASKDDPTVFYGVTAPGVNIAPSGDAVLNITTKRVTFSIEAGALDVGDIDSVLSQPPYLVGAGDVVAGGGSGASACSSRVACLPRFRDFQTISYGGAEYTLEKWSGEMHYQKIGLAGSVESCNFLILNTDQGDTLGYGINIDNNYSEGEIQEIFTEFTRIKTLSFIGMKYNDGSGGCNSDKQDIEVGNPEGFLQIFKYDDQSESLKPIPKDYGDNEKKLVEEYKLKAGTTDTYVAGASAGCEGDDASYIRMSSPPTGASLVEARWSLIKNPDNCAKAETTIVVGVISAAERAVADDEIAGAEAVAGSTQPPEKTCSSEGGLLGWILCPFLTLLDEATQWLENQIRGYLFISPDQFGTDDGPSGGLYRSWSVFRGLATVIIVIISLIMIFSQAMGDGIFNNYSVKKLLPRLILAGIAVQLSWFLITELVNVFNILGNGISGIMLSPFTYVDETTGITSLTTDTNLRDILPDASVGTDGLMVGLVIGGGIAVIGAIGALAAGAALALITGFITLIVRNMIIYLGVIFAPIAIAASVLPGTQKLSKWWWESLEKALMMYPLVMALLAIGKIVSNIFMQSNSGQDENGPGIATMIAAIGAWYAPYFFIPKALQAGGSALGKITGLAGDKGKGLMNRAKGWDDTRRKNRKEIGTNRAFNGTTSFWERGGKKNPLSFVGKAGRARRIAGTHLAAGNIGLGTERQIARDQARAKAGETGAQISAYEAYAKTLADMSTKERKDYKDKEEAGGRGSIILDNAAIKAKEIELQGAKFDLVRAKAEIKEKEETAAVARAAIGFGSIGGPEGVRELIGHATNEKNSTAVQRAAVEQLIKIGSSEGLEAVGLTPVGQAAIKAAADGGGKYSAIKEFAPHMLGGKSGGTDDPAFKGAYKIDPATGLHALGPDRKKIHDPTNIASAEEMSKWSAGTWRLALASGNKNINYRAQEILDNPKIASTLGGEIPGILENAKMRRQLPPPPLPPPTP